MIECNFTIREIASRDRPRATNLLDKRWGSSLIVTRGRPHNTDRLPGFAARIGPVAQGLITYDIQRDQCEIVSLDSLTEKIGIGSRLIGAVKQQAIGQSCRRLWLITTNDNTLALRFYQKRGFDIAAIHLGA